MKIRLSVFAARLFYCNLSPKVLHFYRGDIMAVKDSNKRIFITLGKNEERLLNVYCDECKTTKSKLVASLIKEELERFASTNTKVSIADK